MKEEKEQTEIDTGGNVTLRWPKLMQMPLMQRVEFLLQLLENPTAKAKCFVSLRKF